MTIPKVCKFIPKLSRSGFYRSLCAQSSPRIVDVPKTDQDSKHVNYRKFPERVARIETCGNLYDEWRKADKFWKVPEDDLTFDVRYIDTLHGAEEDEGKSPNVNEDSAVVLALHGAPGSYNDYGLLTSYLYDRGVRVIAPCFPG